MISRSPWPRSRLARQFSDRSKAPERSGAFVLSMALPHLCKLLRYQANALALNIFLFSDFLRKPNCFVEASQVWEKALNIFLILPIRRCECHATASIHSAISCNGGMRSVASLRRLRSNRPGKYEYRTGSPAYSRQRDPHDLHAIATSTCSGERRHQLFDTHWRAETGSENRGIGVSCGTPGSLRHPALRDDVADNHHRSAITFPF